MADIPQGMLATAVNPTNWNVLVDKINDLVNGINTPSAFDDRDGTPSVSPDRHFKTANTGATTITMFDDGTDGQLITVLIDDAFTTIDFTSTHLKGNGGVDWSPSAGEHMMCFFDGTDWYCDITTASPYFTSITLSNVGLRLLDTDASHVLIIKPGSDLSADKTLTLTTGNADRTITLSGNPTLSDWFDQAVKVASSPTFVDLTLTGALIATVDTFTADDVTPSVSGGVNFLTANTEAKTITQFDDGVNGQLINIIAGDDDTTIASNANIKHNAGAPRILGEYDVAKFIHNGTLWVGAGYEQNGA